MLSLLYQEGPSTKGIFRRSGSAKTFKELKEKLDSGTEVDLARESIFVTASLFKVCEECSCLSFWVGAAQILCSSREGFSPGTGPKRNELRRMGGTLTLWGSPQEATTELGWGRGVASLFCWQLSWGLCCSLVLLLSAYERHQYYLTLQILVSL